MSQHIQHPESPDLYKAINQDEQLRGLYELKIKYYQRTFPTVVIDGDGNTSIVCDENIPNIPELDEMIKDRISQIIDLFNKK